MTIDLNKYKNVHMIGIGGISMSALAEVLKFKGINVTGCDAKDSSMVEKLISHHIPVSIGHDESHLKNTDLVVHTVAVKENNPEIKKAIEDHIPVIDRAELLGSIMKNYKYRIAVAGCHGKTTTTSMLAVLMQNEKLDPTILDGGEIKEISGNVRIGKSEYFLTEACEYCDSFLKFYPYIGVILNIDSDHLDYFGNLENIKSSFIKFASLIPQDGYLIACNDNMNVRDILQKINKTTVTYGIDWPSDYMAQNISFDGNGFSSFDLYDKGEFKGRVELSVPGIHNIYNALATIAVGHILKIKFESIKKTLKLFKGTHRRFEIKGKVNGVTIIDDYAHHPTEIKATLKAALNYPHKKILCVFQPHTYSRTKLLLGEFTKAFDCADKVIITDIYAAREQDLGIINSKTLSDLLSQRGIDSRYIKDFDDVITFLNQNAEEGDIVLTIGAGDVYKIGDMYLNQI